MNRGMLISQIKELLSEIAPTASAILYGSYARGEENADSDVDLLILLDKESISFSEESRITDPLYDFEFKNGVIMSPVVMTRSAWEKTRYKSSLYHQVQEQGIVIQ